MRYVLFLNFISSHTVGHFLSVRQRSEGGNENKKSAPNRVRFLKLCIRRRQKPPERYPDRWLLQSFPVAHATVRLMLLRSRPDMVHSATLHGTLLSTLLICSKPPKARPRTAFSPAVADCRFRAPLAPHLAQYKHYKPKLCFLQLNILLQKQTT